ncbi:type II toxin-antitoxin system VapB family antitoxin [uncultured Microbacterium sp.]|jgi:Arc/MetJ family transcription regulator|uniref:type II toxin-antitoxin system VapB family antitoxin n=1 Tax=uncultured Microbacterium sp. TaxID=191216 RepID=UPI0025D31770|nr:type II toxin-antitoxin system VapB family antitoxin [uncultured Microbacterium sp.]
MTRTNIDIDDDLVETAMRTYDLKTKKDAVDFALRRLVGVPLTTEFILGLEGTGWSGDLDWMRTAPSAWESE